MKIPFDINGTIIKIEPYNTFKEKDVLMLCTHGIDGETGLDSTLEILLPDQMDVIKNLNINEKKVLLYKLREISVGDEIDVKYVCSNCGQGNDGVIEATNFLIKSKRNDPDIKKLPGDFNEDKLQDYLNISQEEIDDLDIDEYENLIERVKDNQDSFSFIKSCSCLKCRTKKDFYLGDPKYIMEIMSEDTLMTLYKTYNHLVYFGKYTKQDVDSMLPFERTLFVGLLNKTKEDLNS